MRKNAGALFYGFCGAHQFDDNSEGVEMFW